jgi:uncharacterized protein (TIRG00374 family)
MKKILLSLLGLALFLFIVLSIGLDKIIESLMAINPAMFLAVFVPLAVSVFLKGIKQRMILSPFKEGTSLFENTKIWLVGFFFGTASPAKSGDTVRALYLRNNFGISLGEGLAVVFVERILDIALLFAFAFMGLFLLVLPAQADQGILFPLVVFFVLFAAALLLLLKKNLLKIVVKPFFNMFAPEKFKQSLKEGFNDFYKAISVYKSKRRHSLGVGLLTVLSWFVVFVQMYVTALALSINVPFLMFVSVVPVIILVEALPISISGLGTRELASVGMLGLLGIMPALAISFSITVLVFNLIAATAGFLIFNSMKKPI